MNEEIRERREETWERLVIQGVAYGTVVSELADKYDTTESAIKADISRMDDWLPELDEASLSSGVSRLRELRDNRQRKQQMAHEAREVDNLKLELEIRREIDQAIETDVTLAQSLGETEREDETLDDLLRRFRKQ